MAFRYRAHARRRAAVAALVGLAVIVTFGLQLALPAIALISLVYYAHQVAAAFVGDEEVAHPDLAFVIAVNSLVILAVQAVVFFEGFRPG